MTFFDKKSIWDKQVPKNRELKYLGAEFFEYVSERKYQLAILTLDAIDNWIETHPVVKGDKHDTSELNSSAVVQGHEHDCTAEELYKG